MGNMDRWFLLGDKYMECDSLTMYYDQFESSDSSDNTLTKQYNRNIQMTNKVGFVSEKWASMLQQYLEWS